MTRIYDDSLAQEPDYYQEQIDELQARVKELEKTVKGLCNIQKENWENFYKAVVEKEGK